MQHYLWKWYQPFLHISTHVPRSAWKFKVLGDLKSHRNILKFKMFWLLDSPRTEGWRRREGIWCIYSQPWFQFFLTRRSSSGSFSRSDWCLLKAEAERLTEARPAGSTCFLSERRRPYQLSYPEPSFSSSVFSFPTLASHVVSVSCPGHLTTEYIIQVQSHSEKHLYF